jgi:hypothetical protein
MIEVNNLHRHGMHPRRRKSYSCYLFLAYWHRDCNDSVLFLACEEDMDIGFSIYNEEPEALTEVLDIIRDTSRAKAVLANHWAYYGKLFDWLNRCGNSIDPDLIRNLLRDHIVEHSAVDPGSRQGSRKREHAVRVCRDRSLDPSL